MIGIWTRLTEASPRFPAVLFLHGFPGSEKNVDMQRALLGRGIASFALHFRGAWGSGGEYRFSRLIDDARAGWRFMRGLEGVDPRRTAVFGFSMGGWAALHLSAREPACRAVVAVAPVGGAEMVQPGSRLRLSRLARPLTTPPNPELYRDFVASVRRWDPAESAARRRCPLLLIHGGADDVVSIAVSRRLHAAAAAPKRLVIIPAAFHDFLEQRERLTRLVAGWLSDVLSRWGRRADFADP